MRALILAGGYGTRLRPLTLEMPKELLPIVDKPVIEYLLENLAKHGIRDVHISVNNVFAEALRKHIGDGARLGLRSVDFIVENSGGEHGKLGAVGALEFVGKKLGKDADYLIVGADNFSPDFDFSAMMESHKRSGCGVTIALHKLKQKELLSFLGVAEILPSGRVLRFREKPKDPVSDLISTAIYIVHPAFFHEHVPAYVEKKRKEGVKPDNLGDIWEHMLKAGHLINGYVSTQFWMDIGKSQGYLLAHAHMMEKNYENRVVIDKQAVVGGSVDAHGPVLVSAEARLGKGVVLGQFTHIMDGAEVGDGTSIESSLVFPNAKIKPGCFLRNCIVPNGTIVRAGTLIDEGYQIVGAALPAAIPAGRHASAGNGGHRLSGSVI